MHPGGQNKIDHHCSRR